MNCPCRGLALNITSLPIDIQKKSVENIDAINKKPPSETEDGGSVGGIFFGGPADRIHGPVTLRPRFAPGLLFSEKCPAVKASRVLAEWMES